MPIKRARGTCEVFRYYQWCQGLSHQFSKPLPTLLKKIALLYLYVWKVKTRCSGSLGRGWGLGILLPEYLPCPFSCIFQSLNPMEKHPPLTLVYKRVRTRSLDSSISKAWSLSRGANDAIEFPAEADKTSRFPRVNDDDEGMPPTAWAFSFSVEPSLAAFRLLTVICWANRRGDLGFSQHWKYTLGK